MSYNFSNFATDCKIDFSKMDDSMEDSFFTDSPSKTCLSEEISAVDGKIIYFTIRYKSGIIVLMNHPASFTIKKHLQIKVLLGSVSVFGYEMNPTKLPLKVLSMKGTGLIKIKTNMCENLWNKEGSLRNFRSKIDHITGQRRRTDSLLHKMEDTTIVVLIKRCVYPTNLQLLELYCPNMFKSSGIPPKKLRALCVESNYSPIQFGSDEEKLAADIVSKVHNANVTSVDAPRIFIFGPKNTGKSTLIRYLINRILSGFLVACYLDTDPGQPEFTPPGVVSLHEVTNAVIGPPFAHQKDPISMVYTGDISVSSPHMYTRSVSRLMQLYTEKYKNVPLFVNTMGWMQGIGLECLKNVMSIVNPTIVVELVNADEVSMFDYREYVSKDSVYYQICSPHEEKNPSFSPKEKREFSIISYLGKSLSPYLGAVPVNQIRPYCVSWDKIPVYIFHKEVQPCKLVEAISLSFVALCRVPTTEILVNLKPKFAMTLRDEPENECLGFGLVKAVDETAHLLYIVTPLEMYELKKVNAIMKGNIMVPDALTLKQDMERTLLNFVRDMRREESFDDEHEMTNSEMEISDEESSVSRDAKYDSAKCYRKAIPNRYIRPSRKFK